jgi:hypothetical protein
VSWGLAQFGKFVGYRSISRRAPKNNLNSRPKGPAEPRR